MNESKTYKRIQVSLDDLYQSLLRISTWKTLGFYEVKQRYRRSTLGPWWTTVSMLIFVIVIGGVFSRVFTLDHKLYMPYFCSGYLIWALVSTCIVEATELFRNNSGFIKQIPLPLNIYLFKFLTKNTIIFFHNFVVLLIVFLYYQFNPGINVILAIPGFFLLLLNLYWVSLVIAFACTRFRDLTPIVNSMIQILFLATPISWKKTILNQDSIYLKYNPLLYVLEIVRDPLLGSIPSTQTYIIVGSITFIGFLSSVYICSFCKQRLAFWVD